ncbi:MAG: stage II sporulation protein E, partial [Planctomycetaceae bacterium]|nr:stage II sporulation protein E [Planctomycetaceae bacterium]
MTATQGLIGGKAVDWRHRLDLIIEMMREMSLQTDPQAMVRAYGERIRQIMPANRYVALSRRDLEFPKYRITRSSLWKDEIDPWKQRDRLPLLEGGLFGELIYGDEPRIIDELEVAPDDPAAAYFEGQRSLIAIP